MQLNQKLVSGVPKNNDENEGRVTGPGSIPDPVLDWLGDICSNKSR